MVLFSRNFIRTFCWFAALPLLLAACAVPKAPTGGKRDEKGPVVLATKPAPRTLNFQGETIEFFFNEYLNPGDLSRAVFISPLPQTPPKLTMAGKKIRIQFQESLRPNTTYVITLGTGIQDFNEKNPLDSPYQFAFSTGAFLDTCVVRGQMVSPLTGQPQKGFTALLFQADSVADGRFAHRRPAYAATATEKGDFELAYLAPGRYRIFGVEDADRNFQYNMPNEKVAMAINDEVLLDTANNAAQVRLTAFAPDALAPRLSRMELLHPKVALLTFNEPLLTGAMAEIDGQKYRLQFTDEDKGLVWRMPLPREITDSVQLRITGAADTAGNAMDTTFWYRARKKKASEKYSVKPAPKPNNNPFLLDFLTTAVLDSAALAEGKIYLMDTSRKKIPVSASFQDFILRLKVPPKLDSTQTYRLFLDSTLVSAEGYRLDSTLKFPFQLPDTANRGTMRGKVRSEKKNLVLILTHLGSKRDFVFQTETFSIPFAPAGNYRITVIEDWDGNGRWTTGKVLPKKMPEPYTIYEDQINLKPNWLMDDIIIEYD